MYKGVILDLDTIGPTDLNLDELMALPVEWHFFGNTSKDQVTERIVDVDFVITNKVVINADHFVKAKKLKLIALSATGFNNIDIEAARQHNVTVCNCVAYCTPSVVQHTFSLLLALSTRLLDYHRDCMSGRWQNSELFSFLDYPIHELSGKTLGIVGYGELGQAVAKVAEAFGMTVRVASLPGREVEGRTPLAELLPQLDVLSLHCPLNDQTRDLIGAQELAAMPSHALLINVARGGIVNEQALADALRNGTIAGAGIDVLSQEPPRNGNPLLAEDIPNLLITPHTAWAGRDARQFAVSQIAENIGNYLDGQPTRVVN